MQPGRQHRIRKEILRSDIPHCGAETLRIRTGPVPVLRVVVIDLRERRSSGRGGKSIRIHGLLGEQCKLLLHRQRRDFLVRILDGQIVRNDAENAIVHGLIETRDGTDVGVEGSGIDEGSAVDAGSEEDGCENDGPEADSRGGGACAKTNVTEKERDGEEHRDICALGVFKAKLQSSSTPGVPAPHVCGTMATPYGYTESIAPG